MESCGTAKARQVEEDLNLERAPEKDNSDRYDENESKAGSYTLTQ